MVEDSTEDQSNKKWRIVCHLSLFNILLPKEYKLNGLLPLIIKRSAEEYNGLRFNQSKNCGNSSLWTARPQVVSCGPGPINAPPRGGTQEDLRRRADYTNGSSKYHYPNSAGPYFLPVRIRPPSNPSPYALTWPNPPPSRTQCEPLEGLR